MSPDAPCPRCGKVKPFHKGELEGVRAGEVLCVECSLETTFNEFLAEVLEGKHPKLIAQLRAQLQEDSDTVA